jgi:hypothetical protein
VDKDRESDMANDTDIDKEMEMDMDIDTRSKYLLQFPLAVIIQFFDANCCCGSVNKLAGVKIHSNILTFKKMAIFFLLMSLNGFILIRKWTLNLKLKTSLPTHPLRKINRLLPILISVNSRETLSLI